MTAISLPDPKPLRPFVDPATLRRQAAAVLAPPARMTVADAAEAYCHLHTPGGYTGPWRNAETPYLVEPMTCINDRRFGGVVFVGPPQSGKTAALVVNPIVHSVVCDPADVLIVQTSEQMARDFSIRRIDRVRRRSPEMEKRLRKGRDKVLEKHFMGMILSLGYPAIGQLTGRPIPRVIFTDLDRMPDDIDGEGAPFDLGRKRTRTFMSRACTIAESSIGKPILRAKWKPSAEEPHAAPPANGILGLYNRGDRRRWLWPCPEGCSYFEGAFDRMRWPKDATPAEAAAEVRVICPNGHPIDFAARGEMNARGIWMAEGQTIDQHGEIVGDRRETDIASFWLKGPAATWQTWAEIVFNWVQALDEWQRTGAEESLRTTVNADQGEAYFPRGLVGEVSIAAEDLIERAEPYALKVVPAAARFLTASVDVQRAHFRVMVRAWGVDLESWIIDNFAISHHPDDPDRMLDPAARLEDWAPLYDQVIDRRYDLEPVGDQMGTLAILRVAIDSAGAAGVTAKSYAFMRQAHRKLGKNVAARVLLCKGDGEMKSPRIALSYPDSKRKDRKAGGRGEVPVWRFNANLMKDELAAQLQRADPGPRFIHLADALKDPRPPHSFFEELTAETRREDGRWINPERLRNEATDLAVMAHLGALQVKAERLDWSNPKPWAAPAANNPLATIETRARAPAPSETEPPAPQPVQRTIRRARRGGFVGRY